MRSIQSYVVDLILKATNRSSSVEKRLAGELPATSAEPGERVRRVARVSVSRAGDPSAQVWQLDPLGTPDPVVTVLYLHGGAYINGFDARHWDLLAELVERAGVRIIAPDYPLAPATTAAELVPWALELYRGLADGRGRLVVMGDSAGGGLALAVTVAARDAGLRLPDRVVLLSPWLDVSMSAPDLASLDRVDPFLDRSGLALAGSAYAGGLDVLDPRVSPLAADLRDLPPTEVYAGSRDQLVSDARRLAALARAEWPEWDLVLHEVPGMVHVWMLIGFVPEAKKVRAGLVSGLVALRRH